MASTLQLKSALFVFGISFIFLEDLAAESNSQFVSDGAMLGQDSSLFFNFFYQKPEYPRDCSEVRDFCSSEVSSGVYLLKPDSYEEPFEALCDNDLNTGGWMVILSRFDGFIDFRRKWDDYKNGFGFLSTEFWLGNDKLSYITNQAVYELRIDLTLDNGTSCDLKYDAFRISDEWSGYTISTVESYNSEKACRWKGARGCDTLEGCEPSEVFTNFTDCNDVYDAGNTQDGVYYIRPAGWNNPPFKVFCNMTIDGGKWTVFQRRVNGSTNFYRNWTEYKEGFGAKQHEFWLGNEKLHHLTQQASYEYRVDFVYESSAYYHKYSNFQIDDETKNYRLTSVGTRTGTKGDSFQSMHNTPFSTYDEDNDGRNLNCAEGHRSGWWHGATFYTYSYSYCDIFTSGSTNRHCSNANLNGVYNGGNGENIYDYLDYCFLKYTEMKIRRIP